MNIYFDLDGPILDVSERYFLIHKTISEKYGFPAISKKKYWELKRARATIEQILSLPESDIKVAGYTKNRLQLIEDKEFLKYDRVFDFVYEVLDGLRIGHRLVLVTLRNNYANLEWQLKRFKLDKYFEHIYAGNSGHWRGKKDLFLKDPLFNSRISIVVGDTEVDIFCGKELKMRKTIAVLSGIRNRKHLAETEPDIIISDINELPEIVNDISKELR